jgi:hypothetical protein
MSFFTIETQRHRGCTEIFMSYLFLSKNFNLHRLQVNWNALKPSLQPVIAVSTMLAVDAAPSLTVGFPPSQALPGLTPLG